MAKAIEAAFGRPLVVNILRSMIVEAMVDLALPDGWTWCSADFAGWDFQHEDGTRLEVKQSAARQTWKAPAKPAAPRFDIAARTGHWQDGSTWVEDAGRNAHIYVLAHHPVLDATADHRDPEQWVFHLVSADALPAAKSISLAAVQRLGAAVDHSGLGLAIEDARRSRAAPPGASRPSEPFNPWAEFALGSGDLKDGPEARRGAATPGGVVLDIAGPQGSHQPWISGRGLSPLGMTAGRGRGGRRAAAGEGAAERAASLAISS